MIVNEKEINLEDGKDAALARRGADPAGYSSG